MNNDELAKSLVSLIDETLEEIEELKKSRFSAAEIKIEGPGEKELAGKPANGELDAKKAEKKDEDEEEDEEKKPFEKAEDEEEDEDDKEEVKKGVLDEAEEKEVKRNKVEKKEDEEEEEEEEVKKSTEDNSEELIKSYVDARITPLEDKLSTIIDMVNKIADQPVERKSIAAGNIVALKKSVDEVEPLTKSEISNKLFELKKNGTKVDSLDMVKVDLGNQEQAMTIANKYGL